MAGGLAAQGGDLHRPDHLVRGRHGDQRGPAVSQGGQARQEGSAGGHGHVGCRHHHWSCLCLPQPSQGVCGAAEEVSIHLHI